jgi:hypothetical protein
VTYKILTLDGGGAWALIEVKALINMYGAAARGNEVLAQFDMVAANSGGSIVLGGLMEDVTLGTLLGYFMDQANRRAIFSPTNSVINTLLETAAGVGPKYSAVAKLPALENLMPQTAAKRINGITANLTGPLGQPVRLVIVGFDYDHNRGTMFRSVRPAGPCLGIYNAPAVTLAEAIHASSNAPINYFDAPAEFPGQTPRYWDGGITGNNNPVLVAVTEALTIGVDPHEIAALSLGTGTVRLPLAAQGAPASPYTTPWVASSLAVDIGKLAASILDDPPDAASFIAHVMTAGGTLPTPAVSRVVRLNPVVAPAMLGGTLGPPGGMSPEQFQFLCGIGMDAIQPAEVSAISAYADLWWAGTAPNQFIHTDEGTPPVTLGYATVTEGLQAWTALAGWTPPPVVYTAPPSPGPALPPASPPATPPVAPPAGGFATGDSG